MATYLPNFRNQFGLSIIVFFLVFGINMSKAADPNQEDPLKKKYFKRTSLTFGGNGLNIIKVNNQFSVMTGGRGSATFRYMWGTNLPYISTRNLNGFSCYIGFLVSACSCD